MVEGKSISAQANKLLRCQIFRILKLNMRSQATSSSGHLVYNLNNPVTRLLFSIHYLSLPDCWFRMASGKQKSKRRNS